MSAGGWNDFFEDRHRDCLADGAGRERMPELALLVDGSGQPAPLPAAPAGSVPAGTLPPPAAPGTTDPSQFPAAPAPERTWRLPRRAAPPANAPDLTPSSIGGVWTVSVSGQSCKIATSQTKYGQGFRAGPLRCPAPGRRREVVERRRQATVAL